MNEGGQIGPESTMKLLVPHPSEVVPDKSAREKFATSFHDRVHKADSTLKHDIGSESIFCSTKNITEGDEEH